MPLDKDSDYSTTGTDKLTNSEAPNRHPEYYFTLTTFLVSNIYDSDQAVT